MEVQSALEYMGSGGTPEPDNITVEVTSALEECGVDRFTGLLNMVYGAGDVPPDLCRSMFIAIPEKAGALECDHHFTISIVNHLTRILLTSS